MWHRWLAFSYSERWQLLALCCAVWWIRLRLKINRLDDLVKWAEAPISNPQTELDTDLVRNRSDQLSSLLGSVCRYQGLENACLPRALILCRRLSREGFLAKVCVGVRKGEEKAVNEHLAEARQILNAHAWVEIAGYSSDVNSKEFVRFESLKPKQLS